MDATFKLNLDLGNAAFDDDLPGEIVRILKELTYKITEFELIDTIGPDDKTLGRWGVRGLGGIRDVNGNTIGSIEVTRN
jgi:hypothetical protein